MRACYPDSDGFVERDGVRLFYEVYGNGNGDRTVLFLPTWSIVHSRIWKAQIPMFARDFRVVTFDGRGNGRSDRPQSRSAYEREEFVADILAVMDATDTPRASMVSLSMGAEWALMLAADHPDRVEAQVFLGPGLCLYEGQYADAGLTPSDSAPHRAEDYEGWDKYDADYWRMDYEGFLRFFFEEMFHEPHSTKQIDDCVAWGLETDPETLILTEDPTLYLSQERVRDLCSRVRCPVLVVHGDEDRIEEIEAGRRLAEVTGARFVTFEGSGHGLHARDAVAFNLLLLEFLVRTPPPATTWTRASRRHRRALFVSSPIGLGHAQRDVAIAEELRALEPDLQIDWLAQDPVTRVLDAAGERIHPASAFLASESGHMESESAEHDLHCFQALRTMDEILLANFMLFHDVATEGAYDLWIGDEAWDVDHFLHENPELRDRVRMADRLRRIPADARRRRARGVPHGRLQRGDDRAHRTHAARARPRGVRRRSRRHRVRSLRPRSPGDPRVDRAALRLRGLRDRLRPDRPRDPRGAPRRARLRRPTSASASPRSAGPASAVISCGR